MGHFMRVMTGLLLALVAQAAPAAELRDLRLLDGPDSTRVVFDLDVESTPKVFTLANPDRVVIDFTDAHRGAKLALASAGAGLVKTLRTGPRDKGMRVVLDVSEKVSPQSFGLQPSGSYGYRLIVDLIPKTPGVNRHPLAPVVSPTPGIVADASAAPALNPTPVVQPPSTPAAVQVQPAIEVAAADVLPVAAAQSSSPSSSSGDSRGNSRFRVSAKEIVIAIDAGHGGTDPGAIGLGGLREKDVTLAIARKLKKKIDEQPGMRAVLTRDSDTFIELRTRTVRARQADADLFVSIHANATLDRSMQGSAVYVLSERGASSEQARWIANHENAADLVGGVTLQKQEDNVAAVLIDISQGATMEASFDLGGRMLSSMSRINRLQKAEVQQAGFMVLKSPDIPSVLVETAFISNPREEKLLGDADYQDKMAQSIFEGVRSYFARYRPQQIAANDPPAASKSNPAQGTAKAVQVRLKR